MPVVGTVSQVSRLAQPMYFLSSLSCTATAIVYNLHMRRSRLLVVFAYFTYLLDNDSHLRSALMINLFHAIKRVSKFKLSFKCFLSAL